MAPLSSCALDRVLLFLLETGLKQSFFPFSQYKQLSLMEVFSLADTEVFGV